MSECQFDRSLAIRQRQGLSLGRRVEQLSQLLQETIGASFYNPGNDRDNRSALLLLDFHGCVIIKNVLTLEWQLESV